MFFEDREYWNMVWFFEEVEREVGKKKKRRKCGEFQKRELKVVT